MGILRSRLSGSIRTTPRSNEVAIKRIGGIPKFVEVEEGMTLQDVLDEAGLELNPDKAEGIRAVEGNVRTPSGETISVDTEAEAGVTYNILANIGSGY